MSYWLYLALGEPQVHEVTSMEAKRMERQSIPRPTTEPVRLERWAVHKEPYAAPETPQGRIYLSGDAYGYPGRPDGERITTGHVYDAEGRIAYGRRTAYLLGEPDPRYLAYLAESGIPFDPERPIRMVDG